MNGSAQTVVLPDIHESEAFVHIIKKLSVYITDTLDIPSTFEQLRTTSSGAPIRTLVEHLVTHTTNRALVNALLTLKWHFSSLEADDRGLNETRANACEIIAWRFLSRLAEKDAIDFCLYELPEDDGQVSEPGRGDVGEVHGENDESTSLLPRYVKDRIPERKSESRRQKLMRGVSHIGAQLFLEDATDDYASENDSTSNFAGLNALEVAAVADAKKFLSQRLIQKIIYGIWTGEVIFWESLDVHTVKKPRFYRKGKADSYSRLRVPKYVKAFEVGFFLLGLALYYSVLVQRNSYHITLLEILLYVWLVAFAYDELSEFVDAGLFYYTDFWSSWDLAIILVGISFFITRVAGLHQSNHQIVETAFDILSLEALFLVPRTFSLLSLHPYFGTLIPCLKEMTKDFVKFMAVVAILFGGFLTTFTLLARDQFTLKEMSWILIKVFFGSSYIGFDNMYLISPLLGPALVLIFVTLTQILLVTSLISILSNSFTKVYAHAREEYLFVYSVYVLEASTSNRLTHFYPPLNLIPLILIRPLRLFVSAEKLRHIRIVLLKFTHTPIVGAIILYESVISRVYGGLSPSFSSLGPVQNGVTTDTTKSQKILPSTLTGDGSAKRNENPATATSKIKRREITRYDSAELEITKQKDVQEGARIFELENKVDGLMMKLEELTALLMAQNGGNNGIDD